MDKPKEQNKAWLGIVLVIVGGAFLADNLNFFHINIPHYVFGWEMLFIIIGGAMLITGRRSGYVFLLIGGFFIVADILGIVADILGFSGIYIRNWWPLILIALGISMLARRGNMKKSNSADLPGGSDFDVVSILSGRKHVEDSSSFSGGKVTSVFGGPEIDLTKARLGSEPAVIDTLVMFGGSSLAVPNDWKVQVEVTCILGGFSDSRRLSGDETVDPKKVLIVKGFILCGGGEIKSA